MAAHSVPSSPPGIVRTSSITISITPDAPMIGQRPVQLAADAEAVLVDVHCRLEAGRADDGAKHTHTRARARVRV